MTERTTIRQAVVIQHTPKLFGVRVRQLRWHRLWYGPWHPVAHVNRDWCWPYEDAAGIRDAVLVNGFVPGPYGENTVHAIEERDTAEGEA